MGEFNLEYIAKRRQALGLTCKDVGRALGYTESVYWKYEKGHYKFNAEVLPTLAKALHCSVKKFYSS